MFHNELRIPPHSVTSSRFPFNPTSLIAVLINRSFPTHLTTLTRLADTMNHPSSLVPSPPGSMGQVPTAKQVSDAVQPVLDQLAQRYNVSFSFGWADGVSDTAAGLVAGSIRPCTNDVCNRSLIPVGPVTQAWTAVAVLQYIENGTISWDTPAYTLLDTVLQPQCGYSMVIPCVPCTHQMFVLNFPLEFSNRLTILFCMQFEIAIHPILYYFFYIMFSLVQIL